MKLDSGLSDGALARLRQRRQDAEASDARPQAAEAGFHYVRADYGFINLGPEIGTVTFEGRPVGPGDADTIYRRQETANFTALDVPETIPIELVELSVHSIKPVTIKGTPYDMHIRLTEGERSFGQMSLVQEFGHDDSGIPHGTFHKNIHIHFTAHFTPVGSDKEKTDMAVRAAVFIATVRPGTWSFNPWPNALVVEGKDRPTTNFFMTSSVYMLDNKIAAGGSKAGAQIIRA